MLILFKKIFRSPKSFIKAILGYTIKFDFLLIHFICKTPLYLVWLACLVFGGFCGENASLMNVYCLVIVMYVSGTSILICIVCKSKSTKRMVENLVGDYFMERYAPWNGFLYFWILTAPFVWLLSIELTTSSFNHYIVIENFKALESIIDQLHGAGNIIDATKARQFQVDYLVANSKPRGVITEITKTYPLTNVRSMLGNLISK